MIVDKVFKNNSEISFHGCGMKLKFYLNYVNFGSLNFGGNSGAVSSDRRFGILIKRPVPVGKIN